MCFSGSTKSKSTKRNHESLYFPIRSRLENFFFPVKSDLFEQETTTDFHFPILIPSKEVDSSRRYISRAEIDSLFGNTQGQTGVQIETDVDIGAKKRLDTPTPSKRSQTPSPSRRSLFGEFINIFSTNKPPSPTKQEEVVISVKDANIVVEDNKFAKPEVKAIAEIIKEEIMIQPAKNNAGVKIQDDVIHQGPGVFQRKMDADAIVTELRKQPEQEKYPAIIVSGPGQGAMSSVQNVTMNQGSQESSVEMVIAKM